MLEKIGRHIIIDRTMRGTLDVSEVAEFILQGIEQAGMLPPSATFEYETTLSKNHRILELNGWEEE